MTLEETCVMMDILAAAYPAFYSKQSDRDKTNAAKLWASMFADDDAKIVAAATKALIATKADGFPPDIGQVKAKMLEVSDRDALSDADAWAMVTYAVGHTDNYNPSKQFDRLPPEVQRAVGSPSVLREWGMVDEDTFQTVIMSAFLKSYRVMRQRRRDDVLIPASVRAMLADIVKPMELPGGERKKEAT